MMMTSRKTDLPIQSLMFKRIIQRIAAKAGIPFINVVTICQAMNMSIDWWEKLALYLLETACLYTDGQAKPNWANALALW